MTSTNIAQLETNLVDVVDRLARKGARLRVENGQLKHRAPKGALSQDDIETLRACKDQILALLEDKQAGAAGAAIHLLPLAFSQLAHWNTYKLGQERSFSVVCFPTRWRGPLDVPVLQRALSEMVRRHDALRTRIVVWQGMPLQEIRDYANCELILDDLSGLEEGLREGELLRRIGLCVFEPMDVTVFPLFRFRLFRVREDDNVLVVAMEHIITDGFSVNLLQNELFCVYQDLARGRTPSLPAIPMQFGDYVIWQKKEMQSPPKQGGHYWSERLKGCQRLRFPADRHEGFGRGLGFGLLPIHFRSGLKDELSQWCRRNGTTLVMSFFVAYVVLVLRWCNVSDALVLFQINGRTSELIERTLGYIASPLYLKVALLESDNFIDLLRRITEEYCNAYDHADCSYLEAQLPPPDCSLNTRFNWLQQSPPVDVRVGSTDPLQYAVDVSWFPFEPRVLPRSERDIEPAMGFLETTVEIVGYVHFPRARFSPEMMERFARNFELLIENLLRHPSTNVKSIVLE